MVDDPDRYAEPVATRLRVLTWNLWWRFGPFEARQPAIEATLRAVDADVLCLQETWTEDGDGGQVARLADALGFEAAFGEGFAGDGMTFGNTVLSRWPIIEWETRHLPSIDGFDELRVALRARIDGPRGPFEVFTTHLNWRFDQSHIRQLQVQALCRFVAETRSSLSYPPIVCGDFNADPRSDEVKMMTGRSAVPVEGLVFQDVWDLVGRGPGNTWDNANPHAAADLELTRRIDFVFVGWPWGTGGAGHPVQAELVGTDALDGMVPSDHYGVVTELRY